jgi:FAD dependent oxidoreductase TIGR03364
MWPLAHRAKQIWTEVAMRAKIEVQQTGLVMSARRPAAAAILEAFMATEMGEGCELLTHKQLAVRHPSVPYQPCAAALVSSHELRIEAREAIPAVANWMRVELGVHFADPASVIGCTQGRVVTSSGIIKADSIFVCPGDDLNALYPEVMAAHAVTRCKLQMLRLAAPAYRLPSPVMSDLGIMRYEGYSALPGAASLTAQLHDEQANAVAAGVHLIVAQSADGSLVVGDSHDYGDAPDPFIHEAIDELILDEFNAVLGTPPPTLERWMGVYASSSKQNWFTEQVETGVHVTVVTCGAGMSTAFAIGEHVVEKALNQKIREIA